MRRGAHAAAWLVLAMTALVLWPERWGGQMTYVITSGNSMAPGWEAGDLAVLRSSSDYAPGDVAAYDSSELKKIVMHRVTKETEKGYTFQGDNNDYLDPETVTDEQMLGKLVVRVPGVGRYLTWFFKPVNLAIAAAALFFLFGDRKKEGPTVIGAGKPVIGRIRLRSVQLPEAAVTAELVDVADLDRLAEHYDRPVLEVDDRCYVIDGPTVYTCRTAERRPNERRKTPQGRDWGYDRHLQSVPPPRASDEARVS